MNCIKKIVMSALVLTLSACGAIHVKYIEPKRIEKPKTKKGKRLYYSDQESIAMQIEELYNDKSIQIKDVHFGIYSGRWRCYEVYSYAYVTYKDKNDK